MRGRRAAGFAALLCVALAGFATFRHWTSQGPFELFTLHAGMPFATLDDDEYEATKRRFICKPLAGGGRFCQIHGQRANAMLRLFVDPGDRIAVIQFWPRENNSAFTDNTRKLAAEWTQVATPVSARAEDQSGETTSLWRTRDRRWSATMQYGCYETTPTVVEVADAASVADYVARHPEAVAQLVAARLIPPPEEVEISQAPRRAPGECDEPSFVRPAS